MKDRPASILFSPFHKLIYVNNQKSGCTTVKYSLWRDRDMKLGVKTFRGNTHDVAASPFLNGRRVAREGHLADAARAEIFTIVRNPFARALSVYLHHVASDSLRVRLERFFGFRRSNRIRRDFMGKAGLPQRAEISFLEFLQALQKTPLAELSGHFRAQTDNLMLGAFRYDHIMRLEEPTVIEAFFSAKNVNFETRNPHAQKAQAQLDVYYTPQAQALVAEIYRSDFLAFGYDTQAASGPLLEMPCYTESKHVADYLSRFA